MVNYNFNFTDSGYAPPIGYVNFSFGVDLIPTYYILKGTSNNFLTIHADADAGLYYGKFYTTASGAISVVDVFNSGLYDYYTSINAGRAGEVLNGGVEDLFITT